VLLSALFILIAVAFVYLLQQVDVQDWNEQKLKDWVNSFGVFAPLATISLMVIHSFMPIPGEIIAILNGMMFGPVWGVVYTWIGAMIGAYVSFFLTRKWGQRIVRWFFPTLHIEQLSIWKSAESPWTLLLIRLIPLISFNLINYALGLSRISLWRFTWTTAVGILPGTVLSVVFGSSIATANIWLSFALGVVLLISFIYVGAKKRRRRNNI
ncbi:TVP38/TMEM64 family protein, partial [Bacillus subtilis]|uniref:TVP38/TMEM64 family protein n=1 Tax=Bacillus subtilis TaxID=1423 RepID=UPI003F7BC780